MVQEWDRDNSLDDSLKDLEWLIGTWRMDMKDRDATTTYEWDDGKKFIRGRFSVEQGGKVTESGTQMIGKDNADGGIRSWVFQSDGGFGDGLWTRDGKKWTVDFEGFDGRRQEIGRDRRLRPSRCGHVHVAVSSADRRRSTDRGLSAASGHETEERSIAFGSGPNESSNTKHANRETDDGN